MVNTEEVLLEILSKLNKLETRLDKIEGRDIELNSADNKPVFHTTADVTEKIGEAELRQREQLDPKLGEAADRIIEHFNKCPPKQRGA